MSKEKRSNKWAFLFYKESAPDNYLDILEEIHIPFVLSPWHDKDVDKKQENLKKHINMEHFILIPSRVTLKSLNLSKIS